MIILMLALCALWVLWGAICHNLAKSRGRDKNLGFLMGFVFGVPAIVIYLLIGNSDSKRAEMIAEEIEKKNDSKLTTTK